ncbi:MAG: hypothetical protein ACE5KW_03465, partial [Dehalococcoidia bacterium]
MEDLSITAFWLALMATAAATLFYWGYSFGLRLVLRRLATNGGGFTVATFERLPDSFGRLGTLATWVAAASVATSLIARTAATGRAPYTNMWEFTVAFAGGVTLFYILFERWYGQRPDRRASARSLGAFVQPLTLAMLVAAAVFFPARVQPLVPALQNKDLLAVHVYTMILAYSA